VPDQDFLFSLRLSDDGHLAEMLGDLTASVLRHVGVTPGEMADLGGQLRAGIAQGREGGAEYDVQFRAHNGEIDITVSRGNRPVFRTSRRLS
jgi:hypothetical protein